MTDKNMLDDMIDNNEDETSDTDNKEVRTTIPIFGDENWESYVLSKLAPREIDENGRPSTAGLRRIAPGLLGRIIDSGPIITFNPQQDNDHRATIVYQIIYINKYYNEGVDDPLEKAITVREVSDAWESNIDGEGFKKHPTAIASTRAEGRALRKALLLSVAVKEEISEEEYVPVSAVRGDKDEPITSTQKTTIINLCKRKKIDVEKLVKWGKDNDISEVKKSKAVKIIKFLNDDVKIAAAPDYIFLEDK